ncbi:MAG: hypothetical protein FWC00_01910 [Firmicutes bacterium]|nr:hypothetical protein [Bacillota bacterium]
MSNKIRIPEEMAPTSYNGIPAKMAPIMEPARQVGDVVMWGRDEEVTVVEVTPAHGNVFYVIRDKIGREFHTDELDGCFSECPLVRSAIEMDEF